MSSGLPQSAAFLVCAAAFAPGLRADAVDDLVRSEMARQHIPGIALAIVRAGVEPRIAAYGESNVEHRTPVRPETIFQSGSVGKQFTAAAVQLLAADGKLGLDDPLARWLAPTPAAWSGITIRHFLTHTSGIPDYSDSPTTSALDLRRDYTEDELIEFARRLPLDFPPGSRWAYSNTGYVLLGAIIRRASGRFYGDILRDRVFAPLGMQTARVISEADIVPNRAAGYRLDDAGRLKNQEWVSPALNTTADGALYLSILDMVKWDAGLRSASVLSREQLAEAWSPVRLAGGETYPYGFGWFISEQRGSRAIEHSGSWQGFEAHIARYDERGITVIVLANLAGADPARIVTEVAGLVDAELRLPDPSRPGKDPDPARTERALSALIAWSEGASTPAMTMGFAAARDDSPRERYYRGLINARLLERESFAYLDEVDVAGRAIERNGSAIARIVYYGAVGNKGTDRAAAYLDAAGAIAELTYDGH